jgi:hypothetical protein
MQNNPLEKEGINVASMKAVGALTKPQGCGHRFGDFSCGRMPYFTEFNGMEVIRSIGMIVFILVVGLALVAVADILLGGVFGRGRSRRTRTRTGACNDARATGGAADVRSEPEAANHNGRG